jgi:hypothetical protein
MSEFSLPRTSSPAPISTEGLLKALVQTVRGALREKSMEDYNLAVEVAQSERVRSARADDEERSVTNLRLVCLDRISIPVQLAVTHVGGNVYNIQCSVTDGRSEDWSYTSCSKKAQTEKTGPIGRRVTTFLRDALDRHSGRLFLAELGDLSTTTRPTGGGV